MVSRSVVEPIKTFNRGRDPVRLRLKYQAMAKSRFSFFRGTCHLFWEDWPPETGLDRAPLAWACGDLHLENFGAFKGDNRLEYMDLNDFDEAALAPCLRDPVRCACSILVAGDEAGWSARVGRTLARDFLSSYLEALREGKVRWVERETARGEIGRLLENVRRRRRKELLKTRTVVSGGRRRIRLDGTRALKAGRHDRTRAAMLLRRAAAPDERAFFRVLDVARRIAGTGSLGVERYVALVRGKGGSWRNYLVDIKAARTSAMSASAVAPAVKWRSDAERIVWVQHQMQAVSPALLRAVSGQGRSYVLKELQPQEDRLAWNAVAARGASLEHAIQTLGRMVAWAQLRSAGRRGAASPDELMAFGARTQPDPALDYARHYAAVAQTDHRAFRGAWKKGAMS